MAGEFKVNGVSFATESGGTLTVNNSKVRLPSSGNGIEDSSGNSVLSESGGNVSLTAKNATVTGDFVPSNPFMFRNKVINGGMKISQRGTSFSFAHDGTTSAYTLDRYEVYTQHTDEYDFTVSQYSMSAAEINTTGHSKALKILTGTAESAIANNERLQISHKIEAQDVQDLQYGTASAKTTTLSFWVKSSITGTYAVNLYKDDTAYRMINKTYTINTVDTWEKKTITIVGDTDSTGSIVNDNGEGLRIMWVLASGSDYNSSSSATWTDYTLGNFLGGHVQNGVLTTAGADWYLTGVQLEIGSSATPFEHRPHGLEQSLCQRYFMKVDGRAIAYRRDDYLCSCFMTLPQCMRLKQPVLRNITKGTLSNMQSQSFGTITDNTIAAGGESEMIDRGFLYIEFSSSNSGHTFIPSWEGFNFDVDAEL